MQIETVRVEVENHPVHIKGKRDPGSEIAGAQFLPDPRGEKVFPWLIRDCMFQYLRLIIKPRIA